MGEHPQRQIVRIAEEHAALEQKSQSSDLVVLRLSWFVAAIEEYEDWVGYAEDIPTVDGTDQKSLLHKAQDFASLQLQNTQQETEVKWLGLCNSHLSVQLFYIAGLPIYP